MHGIKLLISCPFLWLLLGAISVFLFIIIIIIIILHDVFDSLRYAHAWVGPELGSQIGLDKYYNDFIFFKLLFKINGFYSIILRTVFEEMQVSDA